MDCQLLSCIAEIKTLLQAIYDLLLSLLQYLAFSFQFTIKTFNISEQEIV